MWNDMVNNRGKGDYILLSALNTERVIYQIHPPVLLPTRTITPLSSTTSFSVLLIQNVSFTVKCGGHLLTAGVSARFHRFTRYDYHLAFVHT